MRFPLVLLVLAPAALGAAQPPSLEVSVANLRSTRGLVRICLAPDAEAYPDCASESGGRRVTVSAASADLIRFEDLTAGDYALSLFHDENGNARLDKTLAIPREGFGFSMNPPLRFGPPRFEQARFTVAGAARQTVRVRYLL